MQSYIARHYPDTWTSLIGKSRLTRAVTDQLSDCNDIVCDLLALCTYASRLTTQSAKAKNPTVYVNQPQRNHQKSWKYMSRANGEIVKALLGWTTASISHQRYYLHSSITNGADPEYQLTTNKIDWYVQQINVIDEITGEIQEDLPNKFAIHCKSRGFKAVLYSLGMHSVGCIVIIPSQFHADAVELASSLVHSFPSIKHDESSLYMEYPLPLSMTSEHSYCGFLSSDNDKATLDYLFTPQTAHQDDNLHHPVLSSFPNTHRVPVSKPSRRVIDTDWVVESAFRQRLIQDYGSDRTITALIGLYLFGTFRDEKDSSFAIVDTETMLKILGKQQSKKNLISSNLKRLGNVIAIETRRPFYKRSQATSFKICNLPDYMLAAQKQQSQPKTNPVMLSDGKSKRVKVATRIDGMDRTGVASNYPNDVSSRLISYLNNLPSNTFQHRVNKHWSTMNAMAEKMTGESKDRTLAALCAIQQNPKPIYSQGQNTVRIHADRGHFQTLKREIRDIAFDDCIKLDLIHSQFAIAAHITNCKSMLSLCSSGELWNYLVEKTGIDKTSIKEWVYSVLFSDTEVISESQIPHYLKSTYRKLIKTPEIKDFLQARSQYLIYRFKDDSVDAFGNILKGRNNQKFNSLISSIELSILRPGIEYLINRHSRTKITLWLHDGIYLSGSMKETLYNSRCIIEIVNNEAIRLNIPTKLRME